jgi:hypothetical protein
MTQADSVHSTPPTNTSANNPSSSRRSFLVQAAGVAAGSAALGAALPLPAPAATPQGLPDPIFAAIEKHKALTVPFDAAWKARSCFNDTGELTEEQRQQLQNLNNAIDAAGLPMEQAACELFDTQPTTPAGIVAAIRVIQTYYRDDGDSGHMPRGEWLYEDEDDSRNGRDWLECLLDTLAEAVTALGITGSAANV